MKIVGIIAEYNPFHKGHEFHLEKAKKITGADAAIIIMSGDYVQRGIPSIMPKHLRAQMALACGADVVLELPVCYATGSAEYFATGAVSLLEALGCVDYLCFGSECGEIKILQQIADVLCKEPAHYKVLLQKHLKNGNTFPAARKLAFIEYLNQHKSLSCIPEQISAILDSPNNILGIEYLKALSCLNSSIEPVTITREGAGYHDQTLGALFSSASALRQGLQDCELTKNANHTPAINHILRELPQNCHKIFKENYHKCFPVFADDFSLLLKAKLLTETKDTLTRYLDITPEIANRIITFRNDFLTFSQFCDLIKTKNVTYSRISRCLIHILLASANVMYRIRQQIPGVDSQTSWFSPRILMGTYFYQKKYRIPVISKLSQSAGIDIHMLEQNIFASDLYESVVTDKYHTPYKNEYQKQIIRLKS